MALLMNGQLGFPNFSDTDPSELGFPDIEFPVIKITKLVSPQSLDEEEPSQPEVDPYAEAFAPGKPTKLPEGTAPPKLTYYDLERTTYKTTKPLAEVEKDLKAAFPEVSFHGTTSSEHPCGYQCTAMRLLGRIEIEICIFSDGASHLVEIRHLFGCRYAFCEAASDLAKQLKVDWISGPAEFKMPYAPPPLPAGVALEPPPEFTGKILTPEQYAQQTCEAMFPCLSGGGEFQLDNIRAAGMLAEGDTDGMFFAKGCPGIRIAECLGDLVKAEQGRGMNNHISKEIKAVCMGALANIASLQHADLKTLSSLVNPVVKGIKDECYHVRHEALRAALGLICHEIDMGPDIKDLLQAYIERPNEDSAAMAYACEALKMLQVE